jgi:hypothetical protein
MMILRWWISENLSGLLRIGNTQSENSQERLTCIRPRTKLDEFIFERERTIKEWYGRWEMEIRIQVWKHNVNQHVNKGKHT